MLNHQFHPTLSLSLIAASVPAVDPIRLHAEFLQDVRASDNGTEAPFRIAFGKKAAILFVLRYDPSKTTLLVKLKVHRCKVPPEQVRFLRYEHGEGTSYTGVDNSTKAVFEVLRRVHTVLWTHLTPHLHLQSYTS